MRCVKIGGGVAGQIHEEGSGGVRGEERGGREPVVREIEEDRHRERERESEQDEEF